MFYKSTALPDRKPRCVRAFSAAIALSSVAMICPAPAHAGIYKSLHDLWPYPSGRNAAGGLLRAPNGTLYGVSEFGGQYDRGTIFSIGTDGVFHLLYSFSATSGPMISFRQLSYGPDNCLYGVSVLSDQTGDGDLFKFNPATGALTVLYSVTDSDVLGAPVVAKDGSVFGSVQTYFGANPGYTYRWTAAGGVKKLLSVPSLLCAGNDGYIYGVNSSMIFKMNSGGTLIKLRDCNSADGTAATTSLTRSDAGVIWGASDHGGANDHGVIYKLASNGTGFAVVHTNTINDPTVPGPSAIGPDNRFYACGEDPVTFTSVYFSMGADGLSKILSDQTSGDSFNGVTFGADGMLYCEEVSSMAFPAGRVFKMTTAGAVSPVRVFETKDLQKQVSAPVRLASGDSFGVGSLGGVFGYGGIYRLTPLGKWTILYNFVKLDNFPRPGITAGADGKGYTLADGKIYAVAADGTVTSNDIVPAALADSLTGRALSRGSDGRLYAVVNATAYTVTPAGVAQKVRAVPADTQHLALATDGNLYASYGIDSNGRVNLYRITPSGTVVTLKSPPVTTTQMGSSELSAGPDGTLYGVSTETVLPPFIYRYDVKTGKITRAYTFPDNSVWYPEFVPIVVRADGTIFGAAGQGNSTGTVIKQAIFSISPTGQFSIVAEAPNLQSLNNSGIRELILDGNTLYGSSNDGLHADGSLFQVTGL